MVSQIQLGNAFQENGKTVLGGSQSGFDTQSLISALATAKSQPATDLTNKNKTIDGELTAFSTLNSLLSSFKSAADTLRNPPGVGNASQNIFAYRTAAVTSNTTVPASNYASITTAPGASIENFSIDEIHQLALQTKQHTHSVFAVTDTTTQSVVTASGVHTSGLFAAGAFTLKTIDGTSDASITLNQGDSLQAVVNKFNAVTTHTGIQADILQIGTNQYQLNFTATKTGATNGFDLGATPGGMGNKVTGDTDGALSQITFDTTQTAQDSKFTIDGTQIQRSSNSISDAVSGLTFNLQQATPALTKLNVSINPDTTIVANAVQAFADAYNNFRLFASKQNQRNADGTPKTDAVLATDSTLRSAINTISSEITKTVNGITGGNPQALSDIGITFTQFNGDSTNPATSNIMNINTDELNSALSSNFDGVTSLFEFQMSSDNANLTDFSRTNGLNVTDFQVIKSGGTFTASYTDANHVTQHVSLTATALTGGGFSLTAPTNSVLNGLKLLYTSSADATINVHVTQGIGDRLFNALDSMTNTTDGTVTTAVKALTDEETRNTTQISTINDQVTQYKDQLTRKFATLEAALTTANNLLALLTAQSNAGIAATGH